MVRLPPAYAALFGAFTSVVIGLCGCIDTIAPVAWQENAEQQEDGACLFDAECHFVEIQQVF